jgi:hypothetical protein
VYPGKHVAVKSCIISRSLFLPSDIHPSIWGWGTGGVGGGVRTIFFLKNHSGLKATQSCNPEYNNKLMKAWVRLCMVNA